MSKLSLAEQIEQIEQDEFYDEIAKQGVEYLERLPQDPESRLRKMLHFRDCLWSLSGDEPRLDPYIAKLDELFKKIGREFRRSMVRDLFAGKLEPEMARETLRFLKETIVRGQWPEAAQDLDDILGPDDALDLEMVDPTPDPSDLIGFGHASAD